MTDSPTAGKQSTGHFLHQSADWCRPFESQTHTKKRGRPFGRPRNGVQDEEGQRNDILLQSPLIIRYRIWFHNPTDCAPISSDSPTAGKQSTGLFSIPPFESQTHTKKREGTFGTLSFFGARDGTRTHTAITTRTSNVLVYHSNTLASCLCIIHSGKAFVNMFFV